MSFRASPLVTVVIPTYRRLELLKRAVDSVLRQTLTDWELVVSDDENLEGNTGKWLQELVSQNAKIRAIGNPGSNGEIGNVNNAFRAAKGCWIKVLHDDDVLRSNCLDVMIRVARLHPQAVAVCCRPDHYIDGVPRRAYTRGAHPYVEAVDPRHVHLAMYLLEDVGGSIPSCQMVSRAVIASGALYADDGFPSLYDACWFARVRQLGLGLIVNEALVEWHQGRHESLTRMMELGALAEQYIQFRSFVEPFIPPSVERPRLEAVEDMIRIQQAVYHVRRGDLKAAARLLGSVRNAQSLTLFGRWALNRFLPPRSIRRFVIAQNPEDLDAVDLRQHAG